MAIPIADPDDPRIAAYRAVRERDLVGRDGLFVAEGDVVVDVVLARGRHRLTSLLVAETTLERRAALIAAAGDIPVYAAGRAVLDAVAGFPLHRGLLGIGERAPEPGLDALLGALGPRDVVLVAIGIANHDNVGALFRNAAAFGARAVLLDRTSCDPLYRKALRVSVGTAAVLPFRRADDAGAIIAALAGAGVRRLALTPRGSADVASLAGPGPAALIVGAEGPGLSPDVLSACETVSIAMPGGIDSLNVATAAAIALHRWTAHAA